MVEVIWASPDMDGLTAHVKMQLVKGIEDAGETACAGGYGLGCCECLAMMENTLSHMGIETADRLVVERFNSRYAVPAAYEAGKVFAENYKDFRFDQFDFWS